MRPGQFTEVLRLAVRGVASHKLRSSLSVLGIAIGVFSLVGVMTSLRIMSRGVESGLTEMGLNTFRISKWPESRTKPRADYARRREISYAEALRLQKAAKLPAAIGVTASMETTQARAGERQSNPDVQVLGVTPEAFQTMNWTLSEGRAICVADLESHSYDCVLGGALARFLFPARSAVDATVIVGRFPYRVVGVLEPRGSLFGSAQDNVILIPITTGFRNYGPNKTISIQISASARPAYEETMAEVRSVFRHIRQVPLTAEDDFEILSNDPALARFRNLASSISLGSALVSSIALLAAGFGIMNIMLVTVTERTREIGICRALGAPKGIILSQFTLEAVILCCIGGAIGSALGIAAANILALILKVSPMVPYDWAGIGLLVCSSVGLIFGIYPAYKAAIVDPIQSLRRA